LFTFSSNVVLDSSGAVCDPLSDCWYQSFLDICFSAFIDYMFKLRVALCYVYEVEDLLL